MIRHHLLLLFILSLAATPLFADYLLITKDGKSLQANSIKKTTDGKSWDYMDTKTRTKITVPLDKMSNIIPLYSKGKKYSQATYDSVAAAIKKAHKAHPHLEKQLRKMSLEWNASREIDKTLEPKIDEIIETFERSKKDPTAYKTASFDLGMVQVKDGSGAYQARIKKGLGDMLQSFISTNLESLTAASKNANITIDDYQKVAFLATEMCRSNPPEKNEILALLESCRTNALSANTAQAQSLFMATKDIDAYVSAHGLFQDLQKIATSSPERTAVERNIAGLHVLAAKANPGYSFDVQGYALTAEQKTRYTTYAGLIGQMQNNNLTLEDECLMIPDEMPVVRVGIPAHIPYTFHFNAPQPKGRQYVLIRQVMGVNSNQRTEITLPPVTIKKGQFKATYSDTFDDLPAGFELRRDPASGAKIPLFILIGYKPDPNEDSVIALAKGGYIILQ